MTHHRFVLGAAVAAVLVVTACGGAEGSPEDTEPPDAQVQALAFADCIREEGIDMPDPAPGQQGLGLAVRQAEAGADKEAFESALAACAELRPQFDHGDGHGPDEEAMLELAECLREQGIEVSDDLYERGGMHGVDRDELMAAMEECRELVPWGGGR